MESQPSEIQRESTVPNPTNGSEFTKEGKSKGKKFSSGYALLGFIIGVILVMLLSVIILGVGIYKNNWDGEITKKITKIIPYPVAIVDYKWIRYSDFLDDIDSLELYSNFQSESVGAPFTPSKDELKQVVLDHFIERELLENRLKSYGIKITNEEIEEEFNLIVEQIGSIEDVEERLELHYGWGVREFKDKIIIYNLMQRKLGNKVAFDDLLPKNKEAKEKITSIKDSLDNGEDFETIATNESQDPVSAQIGGDLGYFQRGLMVKEFEEAAFNLEKGQISDIIRTDFGYHIIKQEDKRTSEDGIEEVRARHILIFTTTLEEYMDDISKNTSIWKFVNDSEWSKVI
jgi:hypothetical protein